MTDTRNFGRYSWGDFIENCPANWETLAKGSQRFPICWAVLFTVTFCDCAVSFKCLFVLPSFFKRFPIWGLRGTKVSFLSKMRLDARCKPRLTGARWRNLTNRDQNFGYWSLQSLKFFAVLDCFFQRLPFSCVKVTEVVHMCVQNQTWYKM